MEVSFQIKTDVAYRKLTLIVSVLKRFSIAPLNVKSEKNNLVFYSDFAEGDVDLLQHLLAEVSDVIVDGKPVAFKHLECQAVFVGSTYNEDKIYLPQISDLMILGERLSAPVWVQINDDCIRVF